VNVDGAPGSTAEAARRPDDPVTARKEDPRTVMVDLQRSAGNRAVRQVLRALGGPDGPPRGVPPVVRDALAAGDGQPLDAATRTHMESRFDQDLGDVRVHTGPRADESARLLGARAYTSGRDIAFRAGRYAPGTGEGQHLLAHELAHAVQMRGAAAAPSEVADPGSAAEAGAERAAATITSGTPGTPGTSGTFGTAGRSPAPATSAPAAVHLAPDPKLARYLKAVSDAIRKHTSVVGPISEANEDELLNDIFDALEGLDLTNIDNLGPVARRVRALAPDSFVRFLAAVQSLPQVREAHVSRTVEHLPIPKRGGAYGTYGPATPLFVGADVVGRPLAPYVLPVVEAGGNVLGFVEGIIQGLTETLSTQLTDKDLEALQNKLLKSSVVAAALPPLVAVAAVHGIGKQLIETVEGLIDIAKDPVAFLKNMGALLEAMVSEGGKDMGRALGADVGAQSATDIQKSIKRSAVGFTYDFGKLIGPIVVWAVLAILGVGAGVLAVRVVKELATLAKKSKTVARIVEWLKGLKRAEKLLPEKKHAPKKLPDPKKQLPDPKKLPPKLPAHDPKKLPPKPPEAKAPAPGAPDPKKAPAGPEKPKGRVGRIPKVLTPGEMKTLLTNLWKNKPIVKKVSELHRAGSEKIEDLMSTLREFARREGLKLSPEPPGTLPADNPMSLGTKPGTLMYDSNLPRNPGLLRGNLVHEVAAHYAGYPHFIRALAPNASITAIDFVELMIKDGKPDRVLALIDKLAAAPP
jgi:hypothetical protein